MVMKLSDKATVVGVMVRAYEDGSGGDVFMPLEDFAKLLERQAPPSTGPQWKCRCGIVNGECHAHCPVCGASCTAGILEPRRTEAPPGPCSSEFGGCGDAHWFCSLRSGHAGLHEAPDGTVWRGRNEAPQHEHSVGCLNVVDCIANGCKMLADQEWADRPTPEDEAIEAVFPTRSNRHDLYAEAMRLVSARHGKFALVALVNWLLHRIEQTSPESRVLASWWLRGSKARCPHYWREHDRRCALDEEHDGEHVYARPGGEKAKT